MSMRASIGALLTFGLLASSCAPTRPIVACPEPTAIVSHPRGIVVPGIRVGPLLVTTGMWDGQAEARLQGWNRPDGLTKFLIDDIDRFERPVTIVGRQCPEGQPLRFTQGFWSPNRRLTANEIERSTTTSIEIPASSPADVVVIGEVIPWGGYFVFTAPGRWLVEVKETDRILGSAVIEVVEAGSR